jgi:ribose-phosphate pyrophosphokinase
LLDWVAERVGFDKEQDSVLLPDAGAQTRYSDLKGYHFAYGSKHRDFDTGALVSFQVTNLNPYAEKVIIIDDLCSKGGTFILAAKAVNDYYDDCCTDFPEIHLVTTHTENNVFNGELFDHIEGLWTTDSILAELGPRAAAKFNNKLHIYSLARKEWIS